MRTLLAIAAALVLLAIVARVARFEYAPMPAVERLANPQRYVGDVAFDVFGRRVSHAEAQTLLQSAAGRALLSPASGAIAVDDELIELGREAFYEETFGNEWFMTDVLGLIDGPITPFAVARAVLALRGRGTEDLHVRLAETVTIGERTLHKGEAIPTGIDVPRGSLAPLGMKVVYDRGRLRVGGTCALCHSTVDPQTGRVVEGAPNADLNIGLLLALATNSAAYLGHATLEDIGRFTRPDGPTVIGTRGRPLPLPDPVALERAVDEMLAAWAPGNFDSTPDAVNNPTQIPDSFTRHDHPFGWSGFAVIGPFRGLNVLNNNVHGLNADMTTVAHMAGALFDMDPEVYLGALLQNAANPRLRFDPGQGDHRPSEFLRSVSPTPETPGLAEVVVLPTFPRASAIATHSLYASVPGHPVWRHISAISAFQDSLLPPPAPQVDPARVVLGRQVFRAAGCAECHSGPGYTNHLILPAAQVGTQPSRARALMKQGLMLVPPMTYPFDAPVPVPEGTPTIPVPVSPEQDAALRLAFALDGAGGYKVKGLIGLAWTAPYLHDGGVAVGPDPARHIGLPGTVYSAVRPDPAHSLRALIDRQWRARVVAANRASRAAQMTHATGEGHDFYVDAQAGFDREQQEALIAYLLALTRDEGGEGRGLPPPQP